jgi:hypothetical protein
MITGAHSIIYSKSPEADRAFLRDIFGMPHVDVGDGWLIFGLPPSEVAVHPSDQNDVHELVEQMRRRNIECAPVANQGWGLLTQLTLPGGGKLGVYQPRHARPKPMGSAGAKRAKAKARPKVKSKARPKAKAKAKRGRRA